MWAVNLRASPRERAVLSLTGTARTRMHVPANAISYKPKAVKYIELRGSEVSGDRA